MIFLDGGFGTMVQAAGLPAGKDPTDWNLENPAAVASVHRAYVEAGAEVIMANTFGANRLKYHGDYAVSDLIAAAVRIAHECTSLPHRVALDIGPTGKLLQPAGDLGFDDAHAAFAEAVCAGVAAGADLIAIETMGDTRELKAAVLAARENSSLPVYATVALGEDGRLLTGATVAEVALLLEGLGVDAYGLNCGLGPDRMLAQVEQLARFARRPIIVKPNAGMPRLEQGRTVFDIDAESFAGQVRKLVSAGASIVGGCCGTTPAHIAAVESQLRTSAAAVRPPLRPVNPCVASGTERVELSPHAGIIIGERINPTGKRKLKAAYLSGDTAYVLREAVRQVDAGAKILDVNCGVPGIDESATLVATIAAVESVVNVPLEIDTADPVALERALRRVNGIALVNSVNGKRESMAAVFPLVRKYGGKMVALCLDEQGIPSTAEGRLAIARRILAAGREWGFSAADFVFDALTLSVSTDPQAAVITLETVRRLTEELKVNTVLGVSNVSFGLPNRPALNNAMYALAKRAGLSAAIANPELIRDELTPAAEAVLLGRDANCAEWIRLNASATASPVPPDSESGASGAGGAQLQAAIRSGLRADAGQIAAAWLAAGSAPMAVVTEGIVPALESVGRGFERGTVYLPQLLMAADAAGAAFEAVKRRLADSAAADAVSRRPIVLATVQGDIHDIGKNIVRALLENYGFAVIDLGRDVPPARIVEAARKSQAVLVGLSALMTTTVGAMAETIRQLKAAQLDCRTVVGGAVVTQDFADQIGADFYAKDAMATVRIAQRLEAER